MAWVEHKVHRAMRISAGFWYTQRVAQQNSAARRIATKAKTRLQGRETILFAARPNTNAKLNS